MSTKFRQTINAFMVICLSACLAAGFSVQAFGATAKISFSDPSVMVGNEVNVTMKISSTDNVPLDNVDIMLSYDPAKLEFISGTGANGGAGSIKVTSGAAEANTKLMSFSLKFKALGAGDAQIAVTTQEIYDGESQPFNVTHQGNSTVKIAPPASFSSDANLSSLKISPGSLTPEFSADVTAYTSTVGGDAERIAVSAGTANANAKVVTSGNDALVLGENIITLKVTAEDGQTLKDYTITVTKVEGAVEGSSESPDTTVTTGEEGSVTIETASGKYTAVPLPEGVSAPAGLTEGEVKIGESTVKGWVWSSGAEQRYFVFYASGDQGEPGFYRYDLTEKTMQRYFQDPNVDTGVSREDYVKVAELYNKITKDYGNAVMIIWGLGALAAVLLICMICVLFIKTSKKKDTAAGMVPDTTALKTAPPPSAPAAGRKDAYLVDEEYLDEDLGGDFDEDFQFPEEPEAKPEPEPEPEITPPALEEGEDGMEGDFEIFDMEDDIEMPEETFNTVVPSPPSMPEIKTQAYKVKARNLDDEEDDFEFFEI